MSETEEQDASTADTKSEAILDSLPARPLPLSYLSELDSADGITDAVALIVGGGSQRKLMLQFLLQTNEKTYILTLPGEADDPPGWTVMANIDGANEQAYQEALLEAEVWREERGLSEDDEDVEAAEDVLAGEVGGGPEDEDSAKFDADEE